MNLPTGMNNDRINAIRLAESAVANQNKMWTNSFERFTAKTEIASRLKIGKRAWNSADLQGKIALLIEAGK